MNCPLCGSSDLDSFEDETGWFCFGCSNNVFKTDFEDEPLPERRPFDQDEFNKFCADPKNQALVQRILDSLD